MSRIVPKTIDNARRSKLTKVLDTWQNTGCTGKGVKRRDHRHRHRLHPRRLRRPGHRRRVRRGARRPTRPAAFPPTAKVVGGYDFVGDDYNADPDRPDYSRSRTRTPTRSTATSHGTHVAGTAAGYGVNADGAPSPATTHADRDELSPR